MKDKPWTEIRTPGGLLDYYRQHSISPVAQDLSNLSVHLERRRMLYRAAGLLPAFFQGASVLEVAPGSGHNSLYIAGCMPEHYDLCEPNPVAVAAIENLYDGFGAAHTRPRIFPVKLEDFKPPRTYDAVICEGWLGSSGHERSLLKKLANLTGPQGVLVVTSLSPVGILANLLRKLMAQLLIRGVDGLERQTDILLGAFSTHLATLADMSRPHRDWIQDNLLNPVYYGICLTPELVFDSIGQSFSFYGSSPRISTDWRWHKSIFGEHKRHNDHFLESYYQCIHNFIDCTDRLPPRPAEDNRRLEGDCWRLVADASEWERRGCGDVAPLVAVMQPIAADISRFSPTAGDAIKEFISLFAGANPTPDDVAGMKLFPALFGRENLYLSLTRDGPES